MASIIGGVVWDDTFEDLLEMALWPPSDEYDLFDGVFEENQRLKGADSFAFYGSKSLYPLVRWSCVNVTLRARYAQAFEWTGQIVVEFAEQGVTDHDNATRPARARLTRYWAQLAEGVAKQNAGTGYSDGAFFRQNAGVTAPGVQVLGVGDIEIEPERARPAPVLGADVWTMPGLVTVKVVAGPGS